MNDAVFNGTVFVGRKDELAELSALLSHNRLVTVTGTGGVGKTRLALEAARQVRPRFPDGAYVAALSGLSNPALLPNAVAAALGLSGQNTGSAEDALVGYLRSRKILLILDTCEHLLDACSTLAELLVHEADGLTLLVTSRQPLDVTGEKLCFLSPLSVPAPGGSPVPGDAVDLFVQRSRRFSLTKGNTSEVIELCRRLDGIPLAIELAAARHRSLPLADLVRQIPRHRTMDAAIAWSHGLCTPAEQALWAGLSVFAGPFGADAAEDVCAGGESWEVPADDILPTLISLVDKSVLTRDTPVNAEGPAQYRMLDTIREFGARRLEDSGARDRVRGRLVARYLARAQELAAHLLDDEQMPRFRSLRAEQDSIRAALGYAAGGHASPDEYAGLAAGLSWYWHMSGQYQEGIHWADRLLEEFPAGAPEFAIHRAIALIARCALGSTGGQPEQAVDDGHEAIGLARSFGLDPVVTQAQLFLTNALFLTGDYDTALETAALAQRGLEEDGDRNGLLVLSVYLTNLYQFKGDYQRSEEWYQRASRMLDDAPDERCVTGWLHLMGGYTLFRLHEDERCEVALRQAISAKHDLGDATGVAFGLEALASLETRGGRYERGTWIMGAAGSLWDRAVAPLAGNAVMRDITEDANSTARDRLGPDRYDEVFALGGQASVDQAVRFALSDSAELPGREADVKADAGALTAREREVAALAGSGLTNRQIAEHLIVSKRTVDSHMIHIYAKLGLSSRAEMARWRRL